MGRETNPINYKGAIDEGEPQKGGKGGIESVFLDKTPLNGDRLRPDIERLGALGNMAALFGGDAQRFQHSERIQGAIIEERPLPRISLKHGPTLPCARTQFCPTE